MNSFRISGKRVLLIALILAMNFRAIRCIVVTKDSIPVVNLARSGVDP